jgi:hypothetical protein
MAAKKDHSWAMSMLDELKEYFAGSSSNARKPKATKAGVRKKTKKRIAKKRIAKKKSKKR